MTLNKKVSNQGFTLIEILVVIGIIAVLAAVVLIAINPARQFAQANNSQRTSNTNAILNAVGQFMADNAGVLPDGIPDGDPAVDADWGDIDDALGTFCEDLVPTYMPALPADPDAANEAVSVDDCDDYETLYEIIRDEDTQRVSVRAPGAELGETIEVTR
jgi:type IV pilus assembly protein PilA